MADIKKLQEMRPLSPHLSIYKPQLTSILSILHRITGVFLFAGIIILSWVIFSFVYFPSCVEEINLYIQDCLLLSVILKLAIFSWCFALFYHLYNGIRHLFWDVGKGFELKQTYRSGKIVVILAIISTICCLVYAKIFKENATNAKEIIIETEN